MTGPRAMLLGRVGFFVSFLPWAFLTLVPSQAAQPLSSPNGATTADAAPVQLAGRPIADDLDFHSRLIEATANKSAQDETRHFAAKMNSVERVYIRVPGLASLSGEYRVNGDGTIALPGLGRLQIGEATIEAFEAQLASEIQRVSNQETSVAVEIVEYKPIFVSGLVARSGAYPWRPGFSVLHAEALAGGLLRGPVSADGSTVASFSKDHERERAVRSAYELAATLATIERLRMETMNEPHYSLPPRIASLVSKAEQESLLAAQQATLKSRLSLFNAKIAAAENAEKIALNEGKALDEQVLRIQDQLSKRRALVKKVEYMTKNRYARGDRLFDEQVRVAELEERLTTTTLAKSRAEVAAQSARQQIETIVLSRKAEHDTELLALEQKKAEAEIAVESASDAYRRTTGQDAIASRVSQPLVTRYEIVRSDGGRSVVIRADKSTPLLPGDVVVVSLEQPEAGRSSIAKESKAELLAP